MFTRFPLSGMTAMLLLFLCGLSGIVRAQTINLNQNSSQIIETGNTAACNNGTYYLENHYYRSFKISDYTAANSFTVDSVLFAIDFAASASGNGQPLTINLYSSSAVIPTLSSLTLLNTVTGTIPDFLNGGGFMKATMPASVAGTASLVVEIVCPDGSVSGDFIAIGSNTASQTKPSYILSPSCSITDITNMANLTGVTTQQSLLINVFGRPYSGPPLTMPGDFINPIDNVCEESYAVPYTVPQVAGLTYNWIYTGSGVNVNGSSPVNQNSIILDFPYGATSGSLGVYTTSGAGVSPTRWLPITVFPAIVGPSISIDNGLLSCVGTFASYAWYRNNTLIPGATGATYLATQGGDYTVSVSNGQCETFASPVTLLDNPGTITIASNPVCAKTNGVVVSVPAPQGPFYFWTYSGTGVVINNNGNPSVTADFASNATSGTFNVSYTNNWDASAASILNVTVNPVPAPTFSRAGNVLTVAGTFASYQWYRNDIAITGATSSTYTITQTGSYKVEVTNSGGCTGSSDAKQIDDVLAVNDPELAGKIKVYPNPAKDFVTIESPVTVNATITRIDGKTVATFNNVRKIDMKSLVSGIYFITLTDKDGGYLKKEKLVKIN